MTDPGIRFHDHATPKVSIAVTDFEQPRQFDAFSVVNHYALKQRSTRNAVDLWLFDMSPSATSVMLLTIVGAKRGCIVTFGDT